MVAAAADDSPRKLLAAQSTVDVRHDEKAPADPCGYLSIVVVALGNKNGRV
jgi:hypothetical protein